MYTYARGEGQNDPRINGEYWLLQHVLKASTEPQILLDVGANRGDWTAEALRLGRPSGRIKVHAFEPSHATRSILTARFGQSDRVTLHAVGLSDAPGEALFYTRENGAGTNSLSPTSGPYTETTRVSTIDDVLRESGITSVSMAKLDTEGFDFLVLKGAIESLRAGRLEVIQFEYNSRWLYNHSCLRDVFELIAGTPYRLAKLVINKLEYHDVWHPELDRFFETNYVLLRNDSQLCVLGSAIWFDRSNVGLSTGKR